MIRTLKFTLLGLGIVLIIASFLSGISDRAIGPSESGDYKNSPDFVLERGDELTNPVEDYTVEDLYSETKNTDDLVTVVIPRGAKGSEVAELLLEAGLISDKKQFESRLIELELDRKIVYGTYSIPGGGTIDSIIEIITSGAI